MRGIKQVKCPLQHAALVAGFAVITVQQRQRQCTEEDVLAIQDRKTGALIRAACVLGAIAGGATEEQINAAAQFAAGLGLAFQIRDDMLDVIGNATELGKATGVDALKNTFVQLYGIEKCDQMVREHTKKAEAALAEFPNNEYMFDMLHWLIGRTK